MQLLKEAFGREVYFSWTDEDEVRVCALFVFVCNIPCTYANAEFNILVSTFTTHSPGGGGRHTRRVG